MKTLNFVLCFVFMTMLPVHAAYHHGTDTDSDLALLAYPAIAGTKLDNCALCHTGGKYENYKGVEVSLGSCQWCHYSFGYDESGDIESTLNEYGKAYNNNGKSLSAFSAIANLDSDGDTFTNTEEIAALRYPGNEHDDPTKVAAPYKVYTLKELEAMPSHSQMMLMNTHKSGDFYAEYTGVTMAQLLDSSKILDNATGITAYAPDGWAQYHPLEADIDPLMYHVYGTYPEALFYYDTQADTAIPGNEDGWCDYPDFMMQKYNNGENIIVEGGLQMLLAYARNGLYLEPGELNTENKLDGEGPFRVVPPQKIVGPPDQSVKSDVQDVIWPFDDLADHNAGFASRSATIVKVEPLPEGTTDIDILEAGWDYVDGGKIVVYGAIDPVDTVLDKLDDFIIQVKDTPLSEFAHRFTKRHLIWKSRLTRWLLEKGHNQAALRMFSYMSRKLDGCEKNDTADRNDWVVQCEYQQPLYWAVYEMSVLLEITLQE